jgi:hypothetical protein
MLSVALEFDLNFCGTEWISKCVAFTRAKLELTT